LAVRSESCGSSGTRLVMFDWTRDYGTKNRLFGFSKNNNRKFLRCGSLHYVAVSGAS
jgi:hypothetical protein